MGALPGIGGGGIGRNTRSLHRRLDAQLCRICSRHGRAGTRAAAFPSVSEEDGVASRMLMGSTRQGKNPSSVIVGTEEALRKRASLVQIRTLASYDQGGRSKTWSPSSQSMLDDDDRNVGPDENRHGSKRLSPTSFVSFFDEVDAKMGLKAAVDSNPPRKRTTDSLTSILESWSDASSSFSESTKASASNDGRDAKSGDGSSTFSYLSSLSSNSALDSSTIPANQSIFDLFPAPPPPKPRNPNAYDDELYEQYEAVMRDIVESDLFTKKHTRRPLSKDVVDPALEWLFRDERTIEYDLPMLREATATTLKGDDDGDEAAATTADDDAKDSSLFRTQLGAQRKRFVDKTGLTEEQCRLAASGLAVLADYCAKRARAAPLEVAWDKVKESGTTLSESHLSTFLYVVGTASSGLMSSWDSTAPRRSVIGGGGKKSQASMSSIGSMFDARTKEGSILDGLAPPKSLSLLDTKPDDQKNDSGETNTDATDQETEDRINIAEEVAVAHDLLYDPTEKSVSLRVKALLAKEDTKGAEGLLQSFESNGGELRLRTFLPLLKYYCDSGEVSSALSLFKRMRDTQTVFLEPENYVLLIATLAENGFFKNDSDPIKGAKELGYAQTSGPELFDLLASEMGEDVLEITAASAKRLYNAFASAYEGHDMAPNLKEMHALSSMSHMNVPAQEGELVVSRVTVDGTTGVCPRTSAKLRLIKLGKDQKKRLHDDLLELSRTQYEKFGGRKKDLDIAASELAKFAEWLDQRDGKPFTAIVDGANVAYYMQNFDKGKFNFYQIQFMVDALEKMNETPLVIVPNKYTHNRFYITTGTVKGQQQVNQNERDILDKLMKSGKLYTVPARCLDDYYWMLASVSDQNASRLGLDLDVSPGNDEGRWPGARPMLVTNDQMRDHKLELMEPRLFRRWYSCHIVNYNFTAFVDDKCVDREIAFSTADFFSREMQGNPTIGSGIDTGGGTAWHIPVSDWDLDDRLCIRIPPK